MSFGVVFSAAALRDLDRLYDYLMGRAETLDDIERALQAIDEIQFVAKNSLSRIPYSFRKTGHSPLQRELVIPSGSSGYLALYRIEPSRVVIRSVRHHLEEDYL